MENLLEKTLEEMRPAFSSNKFAKRAKKNGLSQEEVNSGVIASFLHKHAEPGASRRMWSKRNGLASTTTPDKIMEAIDLLKAKGYKILKPDWIEL